MLNKWQNFATVTFLLVIYFRNDSTPTVDSAVLSLRFSPADADAATEAFIRPHDFHNGRGGGNRVLYLRGISAAKGGNGDGALMEL